MEDRINQITACGAISASEVKLGRWSGIIIKKGE